MAHRPAPDEEVFNQSPPFADVNLFTSDTALGEAVDREGADQYPCHESYAILGHPTVYAGREPQIKEAKDA